MKDLSMKMNNISLPVLLKLMIEGGGIYIGNGNWKTPSHSIFLPSRITCIFRALIFAWGTNHSGAMTWGVFPGITWCFQAGNHVFD